MPGVLGVPENIKGASENIKGVPENIKGVSENIKGVPENIKGVSENIKGVSENIKGVPENIKILLVEDDRTMRQIEINTLKKIGYTNIIQAANGDEGIEKLQNEQGIHVIISDWNMPKKGGLEFLIWVRASQTFNNIPFIMATGQADKIHEKQAIKAGVTGFLVKPFSNDELKYTLNSAFGVKPDENNYKENGKPLQRLSSQGIAPSSQRIAPSGKVLLKIAHIQITDHLVMGVLKHLLGNGEFKARHFELELICMSGWNLVAKALEEGVVDGACILAPLAMDIYSVGTPIKLVLLSHKNGSMFVRSNQSQNTNQNQNKTPFQDFFKNSSFLIPHKMSVHHMLSHLFLSKIGLEPSMSKGEVFNVEFEVVAPVNMPEFLQNNSKHSGFMVAEPIGSQSVDSGIATRQFLSGELWKNHPCCAVVMQDNFIHSYTDAMFELTRLLVKSGKFIATHPDAAAEIAVPFLDPDGKLGLTVAVLKQVLTDPMGITTHDLYPVMTDLEIMQQYMVKEMGIGSTINLSEFIDLRFADNACDLGLFDYKPSVLYSSEEEILRILNRSFTDKQSSVNTQSFIDKQSSVNNQSFVDKQSFIQTEHETKHQIEHKNQHGNKHEISAVKPIIAKDGKYLTFFLATEEYGISINNVKEIIGMIAITHVPKTPDYVKGVINLRGKVIPVMDLRIKFGMEEVEYTDRTCILVVEVPVGEDRHNAQIGVVVDTVSEVLNIKSEDIEENPTFGASLDTEAILGMAKIGDRVRILLNIEKALSI